MIRLAVFDLDGTLVDSRRDLATATNAVVQEYGGRELSEEAVGEMVGEGARVLVDRALAAAGVTHDAADALARFLQLYDRHLLDTTRPYPGIDKVLRDLSTRMTLAVLTNKPQAATGRILEGLGLADYFAAVVGGNTEFGRKPEPGGLHHIISRLGITPSETVLIGDSPIDLETARRAGTRVCIAAYGFGYRATELRHGELIVGSAAEIGRVL